MLPGCYSRLILQNSETAHRVILVPQKGKQPAQSPGRSGLAVLVMMTLSTRLAGNKSSLMLFVNGSSVGIYGTIDRRFSHAVTDANEQKLKFPFVETRYACNGSDNIYISSFFHGSEET